MMSDYCASAVADALLQMLAHVTRTVIFSMSMLMYKYMRIKKTANNKQEIPVLIVVLNTTVHACIYSVLSQ